MLSSASLAVRARFERRHELPRLARQRHELLHSHCSYWRCKPFSAHLPFARQPPNTIAKRYYSFYNFFFFFRHDAMMLFVA